MVRCDAPLGTTSLVGKDRPNGLAPRKRPVVIQVGTLAVWSVGRIAYQ